MHRGRILALAWVMPLASCRGGAPSSPCRSDLRLVLGACVSPRVAADHCGPSKVATADGCAARPPCERGQARDLVSGDCLPRREVRALAAALGILVADDEALGCASDHELVAVRTGAARLECLPVASRAVVLPCAVGSLRLDGACVRVVEAGRVDVVRWVRAAVGPEGGQGAGLLCEGLLRSGAALSATGPLTVSLVFPDNDVTQVVVETSPVELAAVVAPMVEALRSLGGTASHAASSTTVHCDSRLLEGPQRPRAIALENDAGK